MFTIKPIVHALLNDSKVDLNDLESLLISSEPIDVEQDTEIIFSTGSLDVFLSYFYADVKATKSLVMGLESNHVYKNFIDPEIFMFLGSDNSLKFDEIGKNNWLRQSTAY